MVYIMDLLKRCEDKGYKISRMGLYLAGKRVGFIFENEKGEKELDKDKFSEWLENIIKDVPEGYFSAKQIMQKYNVSQNEAYFILNDPDCVVIRVGGYGVMYGEKKSVESIIEKRSRKHKYDWEEER